MKMSCEYFWPTIRLQANTPETQQQTKMNHGEEDIGEVQHWMIRTVVIRFYEHHDQSEPSWTVPGHTMATEMSFADGGGGRTFITSGEYSCVHKDKVISEEAK